MFHSNVLIGHCMFEVTVLSAPQCLVSVVYLFSIIIFIVAETIENFELEDYIEEILFNEFHTMAEDGSLPKVRRSNCSLVKYQK